MMTFTKPMLQTRLPLNDRIEFSFEKHPLYIQNDNNRQLLRQPLHTQKQLA